MLKRIQAVVAAVAIGGAALVAAPASASATSVDNPVIKSLTVSDNPVRVAGSGGTNVTFTATTEKTESGKFYLTPPGPSVATPFSPTSVSADKNTWTLTLKFTRDEKPGDWTVRFDANGATGSTPDSKSTGFKVIQIWETDIAGFGAAPEPIKAGNVLTLSGRLLINGSKGWHGYGDQKVYISFKEAGTSSYKRVAYDYTNWKGEFAVGVKAWKTGWWKAEFDGVKDESLSTQSETDQVDVVSAPPPHEPEPSFESRVIRFDAAPEPVKHGRYLYFRGKLQVWDEGWEGYGDAKVTLWFKTKHGHWKYVKTTWTNGSGSFYTKSRAWKSGYWKVVFHGNDEADGSSSRWDWVRVKH
ncbi:hypothetical protein N5079_03845 [Planotetraspora sp. A-T 1434]|uniref:hypothetical protein n=1 Tax=Planotetraspora sp. A-T 1434 TaxID=2979219 RepID=UPI0021BE370D|nr:hypothetical protein [Planotetraspora sp. A-T 1434]MCT9929348.1 hypothetical protein [Planotetraspora sp. A-T 1434]